MTRIHTPRKRFGQNFLVDSNIIAAIIAAINPQPQENILEIGPGLGVLTQALIASHAAINAVEIDRDLTAHLESKFSNANNFTLHCQDILKFPIESIQITEPNKKLRIVGNLPYNISTPLLFKLFNNIHIINDMFFMLQHEVAVRLAAHPNTKEYGRMSIMAQYYCNMEILIQVPPHSFNPAPKVDSCIVKFTPHLQPTVNVTDHTMLQNIVTNAFSQRRKTISNSLKGFISAEELLNLEIDPKLRAENLTLIDYTNIANYISNK
mgnify:CR=1 FL=1